MGEDADKFLLLDEEEENPVSEKPVKEPISLKSIFSSIKLPSLSKPKQKPARDYEPTIEAVAASAGDTIDLDLAADGVHEFEWDIRGMDCPDCAMKATRAVSRLPGIEECRVSATQGSVRLNVDVSRGTVSRASSVLENLGHSPEVDWLSVVKVTPKMAASRIGVDRRKLRSSLMNVPGVLNVRLEDGRIEIQRMWISDSALRGISEQRLGMILGEDFQLSPSQTSRLRPDQIRLIGAATTVPLILGVVAIEEIAAIPNQLAALMALFGVIFAGYQMFQDAIGSIQNRVMGFQILTSLAVIGAVYLQEWAEALMVVGLVGFSSHLEDRALVRARESMQGGLDRLPRRARLVNPEAPKDKGERTLNVLQVANPNLANAPDCHDEEMIPVEALELGDLVEVRSGEVMPVDGVVIEGTGAIDRAPLTGDPIPIPINKGDTVEAGLVLVRGPLVVKATAGGDDTRLSSLIDLVRNYRDQPTRTQSAIERFTAIWVPLVMIGSPFIGYLVYGATSQAILTTLLLWVVSCPCSLLLAAPVPHAAALSAASAFGLVARGGDVLEAAAGVELALLDKTGTLTSGSPRMTGISVSEDENDYRALQIAAGLEQRSNHPYARSIIALANERSLSASNVTELTDGDAGVSGKLRGQEVMLGRADWLLERGVEIPLDIDAALVESRKAGHGASVLAVNGRAIAAFGFAHDDARDGVDEMISALRENEVKVEILSGDEQASVEAFGARLGIPNGSCRGGVDPESKAQWVSERSKSRRTLMAGDGFNDAGALAAAHVGIAVGSGEQVNLDAADVLIPGEDPRALSRFIELSKRTRRAVSTNIAISVGITLILVGIVLGGWEIKLAAGVALHEASALLVILNGMWVTGTGTERFTTLITLGRDLKDDLVQALRVALGTSREDLSATA
ncbi:MAG: cation-translocating P-type ATPase [Candidatus Thermoplasmatota archaeon]|nr:cation-translocating P-type ATPase [Candidatus Thermoplasmatota archaeon]